MARQLFIEIVKSRGMSKEMALDRPEVLRVVKSKNNKVLIHCDTFWSKLYKPKNRKEFGTKPDISIIDRFNKVIILAEISCPWWTTGDGKNVITYTARKKFKRYQGLANHLREKWEMRNGKNTQSG